MPRLLHVFNRYLYYGGEENIIEVIHEQLARHHPIERCFFDSREWQGTGAPSVPGQALRLFYNPDSARRLDAAADASRAQAAIFHSLYPVGSPSLYRAALRRGLPVVQFMHNFRPFSVGGTAYAGGQLVPEAIRGHYWREVRHGAWQGSVVKSALFALMLKGLHASGWLRSVRAWVGISEFMRQRVIEAGIPAERVHALRHFWTPLPETPAAEDAGYYLFLGRLVEVKGVEPLLQAWAALYQSLGAAAPALHIGGEGPLAELVRQHAQDNPKVRYLGLVSGQAKSEALSRCRALLIPSTWWEPLGLVTYEAYDHAKPALAARAGGLAETVLPGQTGLLHEPGDVEGIVRDVLAMESRSRSERLAMGLAGREWLLRETSVSAWQQRMDEILALAMESPAPSSSPRG